MWAAHQAVPSMYNFENKVQFSNQVLGDRSFNPADDSYRSMVLNHFPGNIITFGDWAPTLFACQREGTFEMCSRYQNRLLLSRWTIRSPGDGKPMVIQRHSEQWMDQVD